MLLWLQTFIPVYLWVKHCLFMTYRRSPEGFYCCVTWTRTKPLMWNSLCWENKHSLNSSYHQPTVRPRCSSGTTELNGIICNNWHGHQMWMWWGWRWPGSYFCVYRVSRCIFTTPSPVVYHTPNDTTDWTSADHFVTIGNVQPHNTLTRSSNHTLTCACLQPHYLLQEHPWPPHQSWTRHKEAAGLQTPSKVVHDWTSEQDQKIITSPGILNTDFRLDKFKVN